MSWWQIRAGNAAGGRMYFSVQAEDATLAIAEALRTLKGTGLAVLTIDETPPPPREQQPP